MIIWLEVARLGISFLNQPFLKSSTRAIISSISGLVKVLALPVCPDLTRERYALNANSSTYVRMVACAA